MGDPDGAANWALSGNLVRVASWDHLTPELERISPLVAVGRRGTLFEASTCGMAAFGFTRATLEVTSLACFTGPTGSGAFVSRLTAPACGGEPTKMQPGR